MEFFKSMFLRKVEPEVCRTWTCLLQDKLTFQNFNIAVLTFGLICLLKKLYCRILERKAYRCPCANPLHNICVNSHLVAREIKIVLVVFLLHIFLLLWCKEIDGDPTICSPYVHGQFLILAMGQILEARDVNFDRNIRYSFNAFVVWIVFALNAGYLIWTWYCIFTPH